MKCKVCGAEVLENSKFCGICGTRIEFDSNDLQNQEKKINIDNLPSDDDVIIIGDDDSEDSENSASSISEKEQNDFANSSLQQPDTVTNNSVNSMGSKETQGEELLSTKEITEENNSSKDSIGDNKDAVKENNGNPSVNPQASEDKSKAQNPQYGYYNQYQPYPPYPPYPYPYYTENNPNPKEESGKKDVKKEKRVVSLGVAVFCIIAVFVFAVICGYLAETCLRNGINPFRPNSVIEYVNEIGSIWSIF